MPATQTTRKAGINCFTCERREHNEWCALSADEVRILDGGRSTRDYRPGEYVFHEGDDARGIYCI